MKRESSGPILTTVFVDYDNIYMSLKRKSEEAAKRFAKDSTTWLSALISGELITPTSPYAPVDVERRIVMNRCYGNPAPRRNSGDGSTDMNSFTFVRHHFLRSGFEVIDCPPLTAQLKNSADIRIVMDIRDILHHDTHFDEFIILSGDADFTPLLHRLRAHNRRTVVFANDQTATPYTAISDGEVRESTLMQFLINGRVALPGAAPAVALGGPDGSIDLQAVRRNIMNEVITMVRAAPQALPLETLADRAVRVIGRDQTVGTNWGGFGSFRDLLLAGLPDDIHLSDTAPFTVFDGTRHVSDTGVVAGLPAPSLGDGRSDMRRPATPAQDVAARGYKATVAVSSATAGLAPRTQPVPAAPVAARYAAAPSANPSRDMSPPRDMNSMRAPPAPVAPAPRDNRRDAPQAPVGAPAKRGPDQATQIQQSIARIHEACQAPALAPNEYRVMFEVMASEIASNGLQGAQTLANITQRARDFGIDLKRDDLRFILDVVSESDPWFEQGASANLFSGRFLNFVVSRCRQQGLDLSAEELDLVEAWFAAQPSANAARGQQQGDASAAPAPRSAAAPVAAAQQYAQAASGNSPGGDRWWSLEEGRQSINEQRGAAASYSAAEPDEEFPRIVRTRLRG